MRKIALMMLVFTTSIFTVTMAQAKHEGLSRASSDLVAARYILLHHPAGYKAGKEEDATIAKINESLNDIKKAAVEEGKPVPLTKTDEIQDAKGRLAKAMEWLNKAKQDISMETDNGFANGLKMRALKNTNEAIDFMRKAMDAAH